MFEKNYKNAMDGIKPTDEVLKQTLDAMNKQQIKRPNIKSMMRIALISCLTLALIGTGIFTAFKIDGVLSDADYDKPYLETATDYEQIIETIKDLKINIDYTDGNLDIWYDAIREPAEEEAVPDAPTSENQGTPEYSDTNNQVGGVQEADILKTDGKYIYLYIKEKCMVLIIRADNGEMETVSEISYADNYDTDFREMMLIDNKLVIIRNEYTETETRHYCRTVCDYYDISDAGAPVLVNTTKQDGFYLSSRAIGNNVYVISNHYIYNLDDDYIIPKCGNEYIESHDIYIPETVNYPTFTVISAFDALSKTNDFISAISILGNTDIIYSGKENLYFTDHNYKYDTNTNITPDGKTDIYRINLNGGELKADGSISVPGRVLNQFSIDESNGILRVATHIDYYKNVKIDDTIRRKIYKRVNKIFCIDEDMRVIGKSDDLGLDEEIKSVRYIGDVAYVVTFRQTDPLYAVDLSDPNDPETLSELKIDGFSSYMHQYGQDKLIGLGYDADPNTGITTGIKVTVFDITDNTDVKDVSTHIIDFDAKYTSANFNHKAVLIDHSKGLIGFGVSDNDFSEEKLSYVFYEFNENKLTQAAVIELDEDASDTNLSSVRALYIGEYIYIIYENGATSVDMRSYETVGQIEFLR